MFLWYSPWCKPRSDTAFEGGLLLIFHALGPEELRSVAGRSESFLSLIYRNRGRPSETPTRRLQTMYIQRCHLPPGPLGEYKKPQNE
jgi:hypothetical protein